MSSSTTTMTQTLTQTPNDSSADGTTSVSNRRDVDFAHHFSSLLFSGSVPNTALEIAILASLASAVWFIPQERVDVPGSMPFRDMVAFFWFCAVLRRVYNAYLEAVYFTCPQYRTQPPCEHALKQKKDLCGRDIEQLHTIEAHDRLTMLSQVALELTIYFSLPGFYPSAEITHLVWYERLVRLVLNHYVLSFGMYWMHRGLHTYQWAWKHIHSFHHWARHPLSRNTYEDHWLDNFMNAIVGHFAAQLLVPLDYELFFLSRTFRILESLEKHSGVSCFLNIAHAVQFWLPFAQMPHHHDWHHEGHKGCNFTFTAMGGIWDCVFGTRKVGRANRQARNWATSQDKKMMSVTNPGLRPTLTTKAELITKPELAANAPLP